MPFIFHSKKQSIFQRKSQEPGQNQSRPINSQKDEFKKQITLYQVNTSICRVHPFRRYHEPSQIMRQSFQQTANSMNRKSNSHSKSFKKLIRIPSNLKSFNTFNKSNSQLNTLSNDKLIPFSENTFPGAPRIHEAKEKENYFKDQTTKKQFLNEIRNKSIKKEERLKYKVNNTPGPGSYNTKVQKIEKSSVIYSNQTSNPLPPKQEEGLEYSLLPKEQNNFQTQQRSFFFDCNYKNQSSPSFRSSILKKPNLNKNGALLNLLFSRKTDKTKDNQSQTTCQSRMNQTSSKQFFDQQYVKNQDISPSPFSYDPNTNFFSSKSDKKSKVFISGVPKAPNVTIKTQIPGPGHYKYSLKQKEQIYSQNQNKRPNKFKEYDEQDEYPCGFLSKVPRQLHFDNQQLCKQELYYSPKNSMSDVAEDKYNKGSKSNQYYFGSSLQRFEKDTIIDDDPYKYCFSKVKATSNQASCASLKFTQKRKFFDQVSENISPNKYNDNTNTISKQAEKQLFRKLLQSKYQDEVLLLKQKKMNMERVLIDEKNRNIDIKSSVKSQQTVNPDKYKQYLSNKKRIQKQNISFGYHKNSPLKRAFQPKKELDRYYDTDPNWDIKSFNKFYGHEIEQN